MQGLGQIPAGMYRCRYDGFYTILEVNALFLQLIGFNHSELKERFHNHYLEIIHPADRQRIGRAVEQQIATGNQITLEYRVLSKDGSFKWVLDNGLYCCGQDGDELSGVLVDISYYKRQQEELVSALERYRFIVEQTRDVIFEWRIAEDTIVFSDNWPGIFGQQAQLDSANQPSAMIAYFHPEDQRTIVQLAHTMFHGERHVSADVRIKNGQEQYRWCHIRALGYGDQQDKLVKVLGIINDIHAEKQLMDDLRSRAERDALTGLYNREETKRQIENYLSRHPQGYGAFCMIDTDNFKQINDCHGHLFGDAVLSELAMGMKKMTRSDDIVGRIGGDEFIIFLKNLDSAELAEKKVAALLEMFKGQFQQGKRMEDITCSIGVAIYPVDGHHFSMLYQHADAALYEAKNQGKNQYMLYDEERMGDVKHIAYPTLATQIDSDDNIFAFTSDIVNYVFQILYYTTDLEHAIGLILEIVGKRFDVSRAYIVEYGKDGEYPVLSYEWCNEGIASQKEYLQQYPNQKRYGTKKDSHKALFKGNDVFYCQDMQTLKQPLVELFQGQDICSTIQCAIQDKGQFFGAVGFDECSGLHKWLKEEVETLTLIAQLISTFLLQKRACVREQEIPVQLHSILDEQDIYIYTVKQSTHELLYINRKLRALDPEMQLGKKCYQFFFPAEPSLSGLSFEQRGRRSVLSPLSSAGQCAGCSSGVGR